MKEKYTFYLKNLIKVKFSDAGSGVEKCFG